MFCLTLPFWEDSILKRSSVHLSFVHRHDIHIATMISNHPSMNRCSADTRQLHKWRQSSQLRRNFLLDLPSMLLESEVSVTVCVAGEQLLHNGSHTKGCLESNPTKQFSASLSAEAESSWHSEPSPPPMLETLVLSRQQSFTSKGIQRKLTPFHSSKHNLPPFTSLSFC